MKRNYYLYITCVFSMLASSCKEWIDVAPRTEIENSRFFKDAQSFQEAINGTYIQMGTPALYGKELTFGLLDVLGGHYVMTNTPAGSVYRAAFGGNYTGTTVFPVITNIWKSSYNSIVNLNNTIEQLDKVGKEFLTEQQYRTFKGEALGLRAFLHFDLLRMYAPSLAAAGTDTLAIPYATMYKPAPSPRLKSAKVIEMILQDLDEAETLLSNDPIVVSSTGVNDRKLRFNYFAVKGLQARVHLWNHDSPKALAAAESVIRVAPEKFPFVLQSSLIGGDAARDRTFTTEYLFGLNVNKLTQNYAGILDQEGSGTNRLSVTAAARTLQYETTGSGTSDYRTVYLFRDVENSSPIQFFFGKLYQPEGMTEAYARRMPLIKIPEMYYIAAECLIASDPEKAINYLNQVRASRGIMSALAPTLTAEQIQTEIGKEYRKETPLEGQYFFYLKRKHLDRIPNLSGVFPVARYVFPLPDLETEFGI